MHKDVTFLKWLILGALVAAGFNLSSYYLIRNRGAVGATVLASTRTPIKIYGSWLWWRNPISKLQIFGFFCTLFGAWAYEKCDNFDENEKSSLKRRDSIASLESDRAEDDSTNATIDMKKTVGPQKPSPQFSKYTKSTKSTFSGNSGEDDFFAYEHTFFMQNTPPDTGNTSWKYWCSTVYFLHVLSRFYIGWTNIFFESFALSNYRIVPIANIL